MDQADVDSESEDESITLSAVGGSVSIVKGDPDHMWSDLFFIPIADF